MPSYDRIPAKMRESAKRYVEDGKLPGDFLQAVLQDSLVNAYGRADSENKEALQEYVYWMYNDIPANCWGGQQRIEEWVNQGGLDGK